MYVTFLQCFWLDLLVLTPVLGKTCAFKFSWPKQMKCYWHKLSAATIIVIDIVNDALHLAIYVLLIMTRALYSYTFGSTYSDLKNAIKEKLHL